MSTEAEVPYHHQLLYSAARRAHRLAALRPGVSPAARGRTSWCLMLSLFTLALVVLLSARLNYTSTNRIQVTVTVRCLSLPPHGKITRGASRPNSFVFTIIVRASVCLHYRDNGCFSGTGTMRRFLGASHLKQFGYEIQI